MIVNEAAERPESDPLRRAGAAAERQMAFYLRRAFAETPDIHVFHDLRFEHGGEVAQIDHLILHRSGLVIVESKSVSGSVSINEQGEWSRWYGRQGRGMPSPVLQATRQMDLLHTVLEANAPRLLDRFLFGKLQKHTGSMSRHVLVAVSDGGRITRKIEVPELFKADQIPAEIGRIAAHYRRANGVLSLNFRDGGYQFSPEEMTRLVAFLKGFTAPVQAERAGTGRHGEGPTERVPQPRVSQEARAAGRSPAPDSPICRGCGGTRLTLKSGKYGPYLRCADCEANTPARPVCPACGQAGKVQRDAGPRESFSAVCPSGHQWPYFTPAEAGTPVP